MNVGSWYLLSQNFGTFLQMDGRNIDMTNVVFILEM